MEVRAKLRYARVAPRKVRLVADLIRGKDCEEALNVLRSSGKRAAGPIEKLMRSALANAEDHNEKSKAGIDVDNLYVKEIRVDGGPNNWRIRPRAMGRAAWINKATSHVTVVLDER
jgi:large subunit ribosomal protein L22